MNWQKRNKSKQKKKTEKKEKKGDIIKETGRKGTKKKKKKEKVGWGGGGGRGRRLGTNRLQHLVHRRGSHIQVIL